MRTHVVRQGECMASIATRYGFVDPATIFDHADNADLKRRRKTPFVFHPGDTLVIPDREETWQDGCATGKTHTFKVRLPKVKIRWFVHEPNGPALANTKYVLRIAGVDDIEGTTGGDGLLQAVVPAEAEEGTLFLFLDDASEEHEAHRFPVHIGHLDPFDTVSGVQARLNNAGFRCPVSGALDDATQRALAAFQQAFGLEVTRQLDDATRDRLQQENKGT